jgi:hypothetical protein
LAGVDIFNSDVLEVVSDTVKVIARFDVGYGRIEGKP